ncbi:hypothetical protein [Escherichia phage vB_EcoM-LTH01]
MMQVGKTYILNPLYKDDFTRKYLANDKISDLLERHGPSFVVDELKTYNLENKFVARVTLEDGTVSSSNIEDDLFFEVYPDEFEYFTEVTLEQPQPIAEDTVSGVAKVHCVVDENNVDEIIKLLQKTFKK